MLDHEGYGSITETPGRLGLEREGRASEPSIEDPSQSLSIETLHTSEKVKALIREFRLHEPNLIDYQDTRDRLSQGRLPMVKAVSVPIARALFIKGELRPASEVESDNREGIYTSLVLRKDYGPIALVFKPEVLGRRDFTGYAVDHVSRYVLDQDVLQTPISYKEVLQRYTLTPEEYFDFFAYAAASIMIHPIWDWNEDADEITFEEDNKRLEQICCDITLPMVRCEDVATVIINIDGYFDEHTEEELDELIAEIKARSIPLVVINGKTPSPIYPGEMEDKTTEQILALFAHNYDIPPELLKAISTIA